MKVTNTFMAALSGAALLLALSGCGGDDTGKKQDAWAKGVCDQAAAQITRINAASTALSKVPGSGEPEAVKAADALNFQTIAGAYASLAGIVNAAGPAPGDDGAAYQKNAVSVFTGLSGQYADLKKQTDGLDTSDRQKFADGLNGVSTQLTKVVANGRQQLDTLSQGDMGKALAKQPGCQRVSGSATSSSGASPASS